MTEPIEPIPQPNSPAPESNWITIDTSIMEDPEPIPDSEKSPEELAKEKVLAERTQIARAAIDAVLPPKTLEDYRKEVADKYKTTVSELDSGDEAEARHKLIIEESKRANAAKDASVSSLSNEQIPEFLASIVALNIELNSNNALPEAADKWAIVTGGSKEMIDHITSEARKWNERFKETHSANPFSKLDFSSALIKLTKINSSKIEKLPFAQEDITGFFEKYAELIEYKYSLPEEAQAAYWTKVLLGDPAMNVAAGHQDPDQLTYILQIAKQFPQEDNMQLAILAGDISSYSSNHPLTPEAVTGITLNLMPRILAGDPRVDLIARSGNIWAMGKGEYGAGDFMMHAYASEYSPLALADLVLALRSVPTTNLAKLERNRLDAPSLDMTLRELVHDERPYVHDLLAGGLIFYETGDITALKIAADKGITYERGVREGQVETVFKALSDKSFYERTIEERLDTSGNRRPAHALDIYKRLVENTKPFNEEAPVTEDSSLNEKLKSVMESPGDIENLGYALKYFNSLLAGKIDAHEVSIDPLLVDTTAWLERKLFKHIQGLSYEDQQALYKKPWFVEALRFQELTQSSGPYSAEKFDEFITEIQTESPQNAMLKIASRALNNSHSVNRALAARGVKNTQALWTGNFTHELIGLGDLAKAITEQGRKAQLEEVRRKLEPGYHPGD